MSSVQKRDPLLRAVGLLLGMLGGTPVDQAAVAGSEAEAEPRKDPCVAAPLGMPEIGPAPAVTPVSAEPTLAQAPSRKLVVDVSCRRMPVLIERPRSALVVRPVGVGLAVTPAVASAAPTLRKVTHGIIGSLPTNLIAKAFARSSFLDSLEILENCDEESREHILGSLGEDSPLREAFDHGLRHALPRRTAP